jgi:integrase
MSPLVSIRLRKREDMATIEKRRGENGISYRVKITRNGETLESKSFPKFADAKTWTYRLEANKENLESPRLHDLIMRYSQDILPEKKPSTIPTQKAQLQWWDSQLGDYTLTDITPKVLTTYKALLIEKTSSPTAKRYLAVLSHAFTIAIQEYHLCVYNPVRDIRKPKESPGRVRYLSDEERIALLEQCKRSRNSYLHTIIVLALTTGGRRGEILNLKWLDIDLRRERVIF